MEASVAGQTKALHKAWLSNIETKTSQAASAPYWLKGEYFSVSTWTGPVEDFTELNPAKQDPLLRSVFQLTSRHLRWHSSLNSQVHEL